MKYDNLTYPVVKGRGPLRIFEREYEYHNSHYFGLSLAKHGLSLMVSLFKLNPKGWKYDGVAKSFKVLVFHPA